MGPDRLPDFGATGERRDEAGGGAIGFFLKDDDGNLGGSWGKYCLSLSLELEKCGCAKGP